MGYLGTHHKTQYYRWKNKSRQEAWRLNIAFVLTLIAVEEVKEAEKWLNWSGNKLEPYEKLHVDMMRVIIEVIDGKINSTNDRVQFAEEYFIVNGFPDFMPKLK